MTRWKWTSPVTLRPNYNKESPQRIGLSAWIPTNRYTGNKELITGVRGTLFDAPALTSLPLIGQCLSFDGTNDAISFNSVASLVDLNQGTVSVWVQPENLGDINFFLGFSSTADYDRHFGFATNFGNLQFRYRSSATTLINTGATTATLHHLSVTWNTTQAQVFRNGISVASPSSITQISGVTMNRFYLGAIEGFTSTAESFANGKIADFRLYNRVLTAKEIWNLYSPTTRWDLYDVPQPRIFFSAGGATQYNQSASGGFTPTSTLSKQTSRSLSGSFIPSATIVKLTSKIYSGTVTPTGTESNRAGKLTSGSVTPTSTINKSTSTTKSGTLTPTGSIAKLVTKIFSGSITPTGALTTALTIVKSLAGSITPSGTLFKQTSKSFSGAITPTASIIKSTLKVLSGSLAPTSTISKVISHILSSVLSTSGTVTKSINRTLSGVIQLVGDLTSASVFLKTISGSIAPTAILIKQAGKTLSSSVTSSGSVNKLTSTIKSGIITPVSTVIKLTTRIVSGDLSISSNLNVVTLFVKSLSASLLLSGTILKTTGKSLSGGVTSSGVITRVISKALSGVLSFTGNLLLQSSAIIFQKVDAYVSDYTLFSANSNDNVLYKIIINDYNIQNISTNDDVQGD